MAKQAIKGRNGGTLTPFQPGESGNPSGMKRGTEHSATRLRRLLFAEQSATNPVTKKVEPFTTLELMDAAMIRRALSGDPTAYKTILDRLEGLLTQKSEVTGKDGGDFRASVLVVVHPETEDGE